MRGLLGGHLSLIYFPFWISFLKGHQVCKSHASPSNHVNLTPLHEIHAKCRLTSNGHSGDWTWDASLRLSSLLKSCHQPVVASITNFTQLPSSIIPTSTLHSALSSRWAVHICRQIRMDKSVFKRVFELFVPVATSEVSMYLSNISYYITSFLWSHNRFNIVDNIISVCELQN